MRRRDFRPAAFPSLWLGQHHLLANAPRKAWAWFLVSWALLSLLGGSVLIAMDLRHQQQHFDRVVFYMTRAVEARLKNAEMVLYGLEDIITSDPSVRDTQLRSYAQQAARRYNFIYSMGFQPHIAHYQRQAFERAVRGNLGPDFLIRDYQHDGSASWRRQAGWRRAPERESYIPFVMAEPALHQSARSAIGLDLLADAVVGPTVTRALRSTDIEVTPLLRLSDDQSAIAYIHALYSPSPPSDSPLMRPEESIGIVTLLVRTDALLDLRPEQRAWLNISLSRQEGASSLYDSTVYQRRATQPPRWLDTLLPALTQHEQIDTPYFPYELVASTQLRFNMVDRVSLFLAVLAAALPSYLILLIVAIRHNARLDRESADDSLFRTRENASVTLQAISDAVITIDNLRMVQYMNPAAERHLGLREEEAIDQPLGDVFMLRYEFARRAITDPFVECLDKQQVCELEENSYLLRPNGEKLLIEGSVSPLFDRGGGLIGAVLAFRDTAPLRRRMLEALETSETRLKQHEYELARVTRITSMGEMASGIAHEINQPLSAIMSYCQASLSLLEEDEPNLELIVQAIQSAVAQADRAGKIVRRLREFVAKKARQHTPVDVNHAISNVLALADYDLRQAEIAVDYHPGVHLPLVYADTIQLEQVVLNLVRNAIDAMHGQDHPGCLSVETSYSARRVCVKIGDNGPGIGDDKIDDVFAPFFSTKISGMGLGLTICQTIIESFGGHISAHNRSSGGAEFVVELPPLDTGQPPYTDTRE
ncbi:MAG: CHASE domain-containing protein [Paludibacterium sp.]|uniref:ATP-binding protein n=1 Tax=Paludibacterium sp. TaxID=1917523 RepID=UPI0025FC6C3B|nr:ATP-binding protein [Paludibacterium sp.]MBV8046320.1 CHASE domain-containing protein [Paludibacterium sp.]MBV8649564.1 CHASE domain-containing protein [Paludibacterium sp.]